MCGWAKVLRVRTKLWLQSQEGDKARISQNDGVEEGGKKGGMRIKERKAAGTRGSRVGEGTGGWMPPIVRMMFLDKCARLRTISFKTASRLSTTLH